MFRWLSIILIAAVATFAGVTLAGTVQHRQYGFGRPPTHAEIDGWNIDVRGTDGAGLPPGQGSVAQGEQIYDDKCAACHGDFGESNGRMPVLAGGRGSLTSAQPSQTVGSYWPYAPTLFDYIRRAMPFPAPESLTNDQVYAVTAYVLYLNNIVKQNAVLNARALSAIRMPNRNGFIPDPRPDTHNVACMHHCKPVPVRITSDLARSLQVTPTQLQSTPGPPSAAISFAQVHSIIAQRCAVCHSQRPTEPGYTSAPMGVTFDTPAQIQAAAAAIKAQAVTSHSMPLGNLTHMMDSEREIVGRWIDSGAKIP
ncbi:MAG TPA: c-type cytochrome [Candidatus Tyrphobacter sp.]